MSTPQRVSSLDNADPEWRNLAACRGMGGELFFDPYDESRRAQQARISLAKNICQHCSVVTECRDYALQQGEPYGVWGGLSERERALMLGVRTLRYAGVNRQRHLTGSAAHRLAHEIP
jgi:WhiB family redox-sensing transcriptional regulator